VAQRVNDLERIVNVAIVIQKAIEPRLALGKAAGKARCFGRCHSLICVVCGMNHGDFPLIIILDYGIDAT
jgi:hypothetical protein